MPIRLPCRPPKLKKVKQMNMSEPSKNIATGVGIVSACHSEQQELFSATCSLVPLLHHMYVPYSSPGKKLVSLPREEKERPGTSGLCLGEYAWGLGRLWIGRGLLRLRLSQEWGREAVLNMFKRLGALVGFFILGFDFFHGMFRSRFGSWS